MTRLHGTSIALSHLIPNDPGQYRSERGSQILWDEWAERMAHFDLDDTETAAKVLVLAHSLNSAQPRCPHLWQMNAAGRSRSGFQVWGSVCIEAQLGHTTRPIHSPLSSLLYDPFPLGKG